MNFYHTSKQLPTGLSRIATVLIVICISLLLSGCAALLVAGAGTGAVSYVQGNVTKNYNVGYNNAVHASYKTMKQLQFKVSSKKGDALKTTIEGMRADETPVTIQVERVGDDITSIGIRTGYVGIIDMNSSEQVHRRISRNINREYTSSTLENNDGSSYQSYKYIKPAKTKKILATVPQYNVSEETLKNSSLSGNLYYIYYNSSEMKAPDRSHKTLNNIAGYLIQNSQATIDVRSYTDSSGDAVTKLKISRKRAQAIKGYLEQQGVNSSQIIAEGYGATNFLESNSNEKLRSINRRVELHIH